jgi:hypothetical protein
VSKLESYSVRPVVTKFPVTTPVSTSLPLPTIILSLDIYFTPKPFNGTLAVHQKLLSGVRPQGVHAPLRLIIAGPNLIVIRAI